MLWKRKKTRSVTFCMNVRFATDVLEHAYERPVEAFLKESKSGKLAGHGALYAADRTEVMEADFSVELNKFDNQTIEQIVQLLEKAGAPLGCLWSFDDTPNVKNDFGTLDGLLVRFADIPSERHIEFEEFLHKVIDNFHEEYSDTAGFQGVVFSKTKAVVSFHGFEYEVMKSGLEEAISDAGSTFGYEIERTTKLAKFGDQ